MSLSPGSTDSADLPVDALSAATAKYRVQPMSLPDEFYRNQETAFSDTQVHLEWVTDPDQVHTLVDIAIRAFDLEMDTPAKRQESIVNTRYTAKEESSRPWGITLNPNFPRGQLPFVQFFVSVFGQTPEQYGGKAKSDFKEAMTSVRALLLVVTDGNTPELQVRSGVSFQKAVMEVVHRGARLLPLSQSLQEYPEMRALYQEVHKAAARPGQTIQMLTALLKPRGSFLRSPRLPVDQIYEK